MRVTMKPHCDSVWFKAIGRDDIALADGENASSPSSIRQLRACGVPLLLALVPHDLIDGRCIEADLLGSLRLHAARRWWPHGRLAQRQAGVKRCGELDWITLSEDVHVEHTWLDLLLAMAILIDR